MQILVENNHLPTTRQLPPSQKSPRKLKDVVKETMAQMHQNQHHQFQSNEDLNQLSTRSKSSASSFTDLFSVFHRRTPASPQNAGLGIVERHEDFDLNTQYFANSVLNNFLRTPTQKLSVRNTLDVKPATTKRPSEAVKLLTKIDSWEYQLKELEISSGSTSHTDTVDFSSIMRQVHEPDLFTSDTQLIRQPSECTTFTIHEEPLSPSVNYVMPIPNRKTTRSKSIDFVFWPRPAAVKKTDVDPCTIAFQNFKNMKTVHRLKTMVKNSGGLTKELTRKKSESVRSLFHFGK